MIYIYNLIMCLCFTFFLVLDIHAANKINLRHVNANKFISEIHNVNISHSAINWRLVRTPHIDNKNTKHVRYQQYFGETPIFGGYAIVHVKLDKTGKATGHSFVNGLAYTDLEQDLQKMPNDYANTVKVLANFKKNFIKNSLQDTKVMPIIYVDENKTSHWAYQLSGLVKTSKIIKKPTHIIDAQSGEILKKWNDLKMAQPLWVKARGYGGNLSEGLWNYGLGIYPEMEMRFNPATSECLMDSKFVKVIDLHHKIFDSHKVLSFPCDMKFYDSYGFFYTGYDNSGYDKINGAYSVMNDAFYLATQLRNMYSDWYGTEILYTHTGKPAPIVMKIHYGVNFGNAFWDGASMTFGDGDEEDTYPFVSPDIVAHEISHGFTDQNSDLFYFGESGAINESFSDMASQALQQYLTGYNVWSIGSEISKFNIPFRYLNNPTLDGVSIDSANKYSEGMDPHESSGVFNKLFYLLATKPTWGVRNAFEIMVKANQDYWYSFSDFEDAACGILLAAIDLDYSYQDVHEVINKVGINDADCLLR